MYHLKVLFLTITICHVVIASDNLVPQRRNDKYLNLDNHHDNKNDHCSIESEESCSGAINRHEKPSEKYVEDSSSCCSEGINRGNDVKTSHFTLPSVQESSVNNMVLIEEGTFEMGSNDARYKLDREGPVRNVTVEAFYIDQFGVSNEDFEKFVKETKYVTEAEKFGNSFVFDRLLPKYLQDEFQDLRAVQAKWWVKLDGVSWNHPEGPESDILERKNHPVVHVSWNDAKAYCEYYSKRLPTEAEWEKACRGGLRQKLFPWGNALNAKNIHRTNIWQGTFPNDNTMEDGYFGTCPVDEFPPNNFNLYNMVGNVWEWTSTLAETASKTDRIKKGGSFLCHESYCYRYRCAARSFNTEDSTSSNLGFRCAKSG